VKSTSLAVHILKDVIGHLVALKRDFPDIWIVIIGGQEAWMVSHAVDDSIRSRRC
jgi:hypothetical protein